MDAKPKRRWLRFSLRTMLVFVTIACVGFAWFGLKVRAKERERKAVKAIQECGGFVEYDYEGSVIDPQGRLNSGEPRAPAWMRKLLGDDFFGDVSMVVLFDHATDANLQQVVGLNQLKVLGIHGKNITDAAVVRLPELAQLETLNLAATQVTDAGVAHLCKLPKLERLDLSMTQVTDAGLAHLHKLPKLKTLWLMDCKVSNAAVTELHKALPNLEII